MEKNKFYVGDCIKLMKKLHPQSVDLILTDPPYNASKKGVNLPGNTTGGAFYKVNEDWDKFESNESYYEFTKQWLKESDRILKNTGSIMVCATIHNAGEILLILKEMGYRPLNVITWKKTNPMPNITKRMLTHSTEFVIWFSKASGWTFNYEEMKKYNEGKQLRDFWEFSLCQGKERIKGEDRKAAHPTQKPEALFGRLVEMASKKGDLVLDPFIGIGTTAKVCGDLKRDWMGFDLSKKYISLAKKRIKKTE